MKCRICGSKLTGKQTVFCSNPKCQSNAVYANQQARGLARKLELITMKGGKCIYCNYNKYVSALGFHHRNPKTKKFKLDIRNLSNRSWKAILAEAKKCDLTCANCHMATHYTLQLNTLVATS